MDITIKNEVGDYEQEKQEKQKTRLAWKKKTLLEANEGKEFDSTKEKYKFLMREVNINLEESIDEVTVVDEWTEKLKVQLEGIFEDVSQGIRKESRGKEMGTATIAKERLRRLLKWYHRQENTKRKRIQEN